MRNMRALVIDHSELGGRLLWTILKCAGLREAVHVRTLAQAEEAARGGHFDFCVMDGDLEPSGEGALPPRMILRTDAVRRHARWSEGRIHIAKPLTLAKLHGAVSALRAGR